MAAGTSKLRFTPPDRPFHLVLVEPEIPPNTGNIGRLCAATGAHLHLVGRLGFDIDEKAVRRAGLDYWQHLDVTAHADLDGVVSAAAPASVLLFSSNAARSYLEAPFEPGCALVFGGESKGLPEQILSAWPDSVYAIPTRPGIRSLNLANAAAVVLYEALRVTGALDATRPEGT
jgi:tRNA (cytidine/uridine-2'-O-)-methyltransferase